MAATGPPTILFEVFWTQQKRKRLIEAALEGVDLPPEDYPFYVTIGADGPLTPTALAEILDLPLSTVTFRLKRLEQRDHAERVDNPADGRSFLLRLTPTGRSLLNKARPRFRSYAEAVEERLGGEETAALRESLIGLRAAPGSESLRTRSGRRRSPRRSTARRALACDRPAARAPSARRTPRAVRGR